MLEGDGQVAQGRRAIGLGHMTDAVTLHGLHEALRHAVALRTAHLRSTARNITSSIGPTVMQ